VADRSSPHTASTPESIFLDQQRTAILHAEIERLPPLFGTLIALYHQQELSYAEIAQITSLPEGTIKSYLFRARRTLQQQILARYHRDDL
jgi:RNA polymerase sigma-70 factor (ECF subfamily)